MGKLQDFLMESDIRTEKTEVQIAPFPFPFVIQSITEGENKAIRRSCQKANFDKRTRQKQTETDTDLYNSRLVAACCVEPNFKDAALQETEDFLERVYKGSLSLMVSALTRRQALTKEEIDGLYAILRELEENDDA